ncbi:MAG: hypothetical protein F6K26_29985 [Moorea sp. SIO2I5]|nr:hypothetical protein [Moorena sp. SIO2I5]
MLKPFHPDGEGYPYQQTVAQASVAQASSWLVAQASSLCPILIMDKGILIPPFYSYTRHFSQWRMCHLILRLALYFWSSPAISLLAKEQDLETLAVEEAL